MAINVDLSTTNYSLILLRFIANCCSIREPYQLINAFISSNNINSKLNYIHFLVYFNDFTSEICVLCGISIMYM